MSSNEEMQPTDQKEKVMNKEADPPKSIVYNSERPLISYLNEKEDGIDKADELKRNFSVSKVEPEYNSSLLIPKENLNNFFQKLASVSRFNTNKDHKTEENPQEEKTHANLDVMKHKEEKKQEPKANGSPNDSQSFSRHRDTKLLDSKFNIDEILNEKKECLLTDVNVGFDVSGKSSNDMSAFELNGKIKFDEQLR